MTPPDGRAPARSVGVALVAALALGGGCALKESVRDSAHDVFTLRRGTISALRDLRGTGPFRRHPLPPDAMLEVVAAACRRARDLAGAPVTGIEVSPRYREVVAKERAPGTRDDPGYAEDWRTAVVATVHPIEGEPDACRVEIHGTRRSPLLGGANVWEESLPGWIDEELAARRTVPAAGAPGAATPAR